MCILSVHGNKFESSGHTIVLYLLQVLVVCAAVLIIIVLKSNTFIYLIYINTHT